jgi:hypothetical protein
MFKFEHSHLKIEYSKEDKVKIWSFTKKYYYYYLNIFLFFSYVCFIHNICLILVVGLPTKSLCSKGPYNSKILLSFVIISKIMLELVVGCLLFSVGTSLK